MSDPMPLWVLRLQQSVVVRNFALLLLWLLIWQIGWLVEYTNHASVWFPVAGLTFAALLLMGLSALPALMAGCVATSVFTARHYQIPLDDAALIQAGVLFGIAHILPYALGAMLLRIMARQGVRDITRLIVVFLVIAAVCSLLATVMVLASLVLSDMMPIQDLAKTWLPFWIGDMAGVMVLAPFFIGILSWVLPGALFRLTDVAGLHLQKPSGHYLLKLLLNAVLLTASMFLAQATNSPNSAFAIFFLVIPHMWIACSESAFFNVSSVAISSLLIAFLVNQLELMEFVMVYQFAICVIAANTLFGLALPTLLADNLQLRKVAYTDSLTQVASRDRLEQRAAMEVIRANQEQRPLTVMVFDIDHFKLINDEFGHHVGDQALRQLCLIVQQSLRATDMLGRFGGDEFVVLFPQTNADTAARIAERIIHQLQDVRIADVQSLTASFGIAQLRSDEEYEAVFRRADQALYQAKTQGRNRLIIAAIDETTPTTAMHP